MLCALCKIRPEQIGYISDGVYMRLCFECKPLPQVSSGQARWERGIDLEDHEAEIMQPYNADGTINTRFAKLYPTQAKALFDEKQLRDAELR